MKEHFNSVNTMFKGYRDLGALNMNLHSRPVRQSSGSRIDDPVKNIAIEDEAFKLNPEEWYNTHMREINLCDEEGISDMDMSAVMESINYIRDMVKYPEGRKMMSAAHGPVNPQKVLQLLGIN